MLKDSTTPTPENQQVSQNDFFTQVPNSLRADNRLDGNAKILAGMIASLAKGEGYCWSTNGWFAAEFGVSESTIMRWLKQLEKLGYTKTVYKEKTRRGTDRMIYLADYPALVRDSTPQTIASAITRIATAPSKGDKNRGVTSATPTQSTLLPPGMQNCKGRGVTSATQLDTVLESEKEKRKETLLTPLPLKIEGTPPAAAAHSPEVKTSFSFSEQKRPIDWEGIGDKQGVFIRLAEKELAGIYQSSGKTPPWLVIESRAKTLYSMTTQNKPRE